MYLQVAILFALEIGQFFAFQWLLNIKFFINISVGSRNDALPSQDLVLPWSEEGQAS